jgi:hypothetical protein
VAADCSGSRRPHAPGVARRRARFSAIRPTTSAIRSSPSTPPNYDGQLTNQQGIHARFETELFERYASRLRVAPAPVTPIPDAREFVFSTLTESFSFVDPILAADREAIVGRTAYDDAYFAKLYEKAGPIMEKRINGAITGVASLIVSAWIEGGKPPLPVDAPARPPRPIKR